MATDRHIDDAIDRAVREMMAAEPPPDFSRRVLDRIEGRRSPWFGGFQFAAAAAALFVAVLATIQLTRNAQAPAPQPAPAPVQAEGQPVATPVPEGPQRLPETSDAAPAARGGEARAPRRTTASRVAPSERSAMTPVRPLPASPQFPARGVVAAATIANAAATPSATVDGVPVALESDAEPIVIRPISIEPLAVEPLVIPPLPAVR